MVRRLSVTTRSDVESARRAANLEARSIGFIQPELESICLAVAELAMNLVDHSRRGEIVLSGQEQNGVWFEVESLDHGPGIADTEAAMKDGFTTGNGLGDGLGAVRRLMDD